MENNSILSRNRIGINRCVLVLLVFLLFPQSTYQYGCLDDLNYCSANSRCSYQGFCVCDSFYYGDQCEFYIPESRRPSLNRDGAITDGGLAGLILLWILAIPLAVF